MIGGVEDAAFDKHTLAAAKLDSFLVEALEPRVLVSIGKIEEQALDLDASAILQQFLQASRAEIAEPAEQGIDLFEGLMVGYLVEQLEYRPLWR